MPATVQFDSIENATVEQRGLARRILRGVTVSDIDTTNVSDPDILLQAQNLVAASAGGTYPGDPNLIFSGLFLRGFTSNGVFGTASYETFQGLQPSSYIIRNTSYTGSVSTNLIPGSREPIRCGWASADFSQRIPDDSITMRFMLPTRGLEISGLVSGAPTAGFELQVGAVNDNDWGPVGRPTLPRGYWLLHSYEDLQAVYQGYFTYRAVAISKVYEDWSVTDVLRNSQTGRYVKVDPDAITAMNDLDYDYGIIYPITLAESYKGIVRVGGNRLASFPAIFGF